MVDVNLLPWRALKYENILWIRKLIVYVLSMMGICILIVMHCTLNHWINYEIGQYHHRKTKLESITQQSNSVRMLRAQLNKIECSRRYLQYIEIKQASSNLFLKNLAKFSSGSIRFSEVLRQDNKIILVGFSQSAEALSSFMENFKLPHQFKQTNIVEIKQPSNPGEFKFKLQISEI